MAGHGLRWFDTSGTPTARRAWPWFHDLSSLTVLNNTWTNDRLDALAVLCRGSTNTGQRRGGFVVYGRPVEFNPGWNDWSGIQTIMTSAFVTRCMARGISIMFNLDDSNALNNFSTGHPPSWATANYPAHLAYGYVPTNWTNYTGGYWIKNVQPWNNPNASQPWLGTGVNGSYSWHLHSWASAHESGSRSKIRPSNWRTKYNNASIRPVIQWYEELAKRIYAFCKDYPLFWGLQIEEAVRSGDPIGDAESVGAAHWRQTVLDTLVAMSPHMRGGVAMTQQATDALLLLQSMDNGLGSSEWARDVFCLAGYNNGFGISGNDNQDLLDIYMYAHPWANKIPIMTQAQLSNWDAWIRNDTLVEGTRGWGHAYRSFFDKPASPAKLQAMRLSSNYTNQHKGIQAGIPSGPGRYNYTGDVADGPHSSPIYVPGSAYFDPASGTKKWRVAEHGWAALVAAYGGQNPESPIPESLLALAGDVTVDPSVLPSVSTFVAEPQLNGDVELSATIVAGSNTTDGVLIFRNGVEIADIATGALPYTVSGLEKGRSYSFRLGPYSSDGVGSSATHYVVSHDASSVYVNVGGGGFTDTAGIAWVADTAYVVNAGSVYSTITPDAEGIYDPTVLRTGRFYSASSPGNRFDFTVSAGIWAVHGLFQEQNPVNTSPGIKTYNMVVAENLVGDLSTKLVDVGGTVGEDHLYIVSHEVETAGGTLQVRLDHVTKNPHIMGIIVAPQSAPASPSGDVQYTQLNSYEDITPATKGSYQTKTTSHGDAGIAVARVVNTNVSAGRAFSWRTTGDATSYAQNSIQPNTQTSVFLALNASGQVDIYAAVDLLVLISGYLHGADAVAFAAKQALTFTEDGTFKALDLTSFLGGNTAAVALFDVTSGGTRAFGAAHPDIASPPFNNFNRSAGFAAGVKDGVVQIAAHSDGTVQPYLIGYIKASEQVNVRTSYLVQTPAVSGSEQILPNALTINSLAAFISVSSSSGTNDIMDIRPDGDLEQKSYDCGQCTMLVGRGTGGRLLGTVEDADPIFRQFAEITTSVRNPVPPTHVGATGTSELQTTVTGGPPEEGFAYEVFRDGGHILDMLDYATATWADAWGANRLDNLHEWMRRNTGPTVSLDPTPLTGQQVITNQTEANALVGKVIEGSVLVQSDVTIHDFQILGQGDVNLLHIDGNRTVTLYDIGIDGQNEVTTIKGIGGSSFATVTADRIEIKGCTDGFTAMCSSTYTNMYVHEPFLWDNAEQGRAYDSDIDPHCDGFQSIRNDEAGRTTVRQSLIDMGPYNVAHVSAFLVKSDSGVIDDFVVEDCYLNGGGHTATVSALGANGPVTNFQALRNRFGHDYGTGIWSLAGGQTITRSGNKWEETDDDVPLTSGLIDPHTGGSSRFVSDIDSLGFIINVESPLTPMILEAREKRLSDGALSEFAPAIGVQTEDTTAPVTNGEPVVTQLAELFTLSVPRASEESATDKYLIELNVDSGGYATIAEEALPDEDGLITMTLDGVDSTNSTIQVKYTASDASDNVAAAVEMGGPYEVLGAPQNPLAVFEEPDKVKVSHDAP